MRRIRCSGPEGRVQEQDVRAFFADNKIDLGGRTLQQYLEQLRVAVAFQQREAEALAAYLSRHKTR